MKLRDNFEDSLNMLMLSCMKYPSPFELLFNNTHPVVFISNLALKSTYLINSEHFENLFVKVLETLITEFAVRYVILL